MPAKSAAQWKLMKGLCEGSIKERDGLPSKKEACEYIKNQPKPPEAASEHIKKGLS